jgi:hypothetical protein
MLNKPVAKPETRSERKVFQFGFKLFTDPPFSGIFVNPLDR